MAPEPRSRGLIVHLVRSRIGLGEQIMKTRTRVSAVFVAILAVLSFPQAAFALGDPGSHVSDCNGIIPTPGSANTLKVLTGGTLLPGGTATYEIKFPLNASDIGQTFVVSDCLLSGQ